MGENLSTKCYVILTTRRRRRSKKLLRTAAAARRRLSDGQTEGGTTDQSASPGYSSDTNNTEADNKVQYDTTTFPIRIFASLVFY